MRGPLCPNFRRRAVGQGCLSGCRSGLVEQPADAGEVRAHAAGPCLVEALRLRDPALARLEDRRLLEPAQKSTAQERED